MSMFTFMFLVTLGIALAIPSDKYTTKYDNVDINDVIKSDRLMSRYFNCLMDRGKCTPDGRELKNSLHDALETDCSKCSEKQKDGSRIIIRHLIKNKRDWWNELEAKYDPSRKYVKKYEAELLAEGITL